jgi:cytochrome c5
MRSWIVFVFCSIGLLASAQAQSLPDGPGKETLASVCTQCHGLDVITALRRSAASWKQTVDQMRDMGASATDQEFTAIVNYLARNFGAQEGAAKPGAEAAAPAMPDGPGKQFILMQCTACHQPDHFTKYHRTPEEWQVIIARMGTRVPGSTKPDLDAVLQYFVTNYPKVEVPADPNKVNMNKASAKDMETRLDLTAAEAEAIVRYRETHGDYKEWRDMLIIYGVDGKKIQARQERMAFWVDFSSERATKAPRLVSARQAAPRADHPSPLRGVVNPAAPKYNTRNGVFFRPARGRRPGLQRARLRPGILGTDRGDVSRFPWYRDRAATTGSAHPL